MVASILITFSLVLFVPSMTLSAALFGKIWVATLASRWLLFPAVYKPSEKVSSELSDMVRKIFDKIVEDGKDKVDQVNEDD